jgi:large subunit ribosomal protein L30
MGKPTLVVTLRKSPIGCPGKIKAQVAGLGLKRPGQAVVLEDTPQVRGMIYHVRHMVNWEAGPPSAE